MKKAYIILTTPRTGSTYLCRWLGITGCAGKPCEFFNLKPLARQSRELNTNSFAEIFHALVKMKTSANGVFGVKIMWKVMQHLLNGNLQTLCSAKLNSHADILREVFPNLQFIYLYRKDKLRQAISWSKAIQTNIWHSTDKHLDKARMKPSSLTFDFDRITKLKASLETWDAEIRTFLEGVAPTHFVLTYEGLCKHPERMVKTTLSYLGEDPDKIKLKNPILEKLADETTEEFVQQYQERVHASL